MKLLQSYTAILDSFGIHAEEEGSFLRSTHPVTGDTTPLMVTVARNSDMVTLPVVLPTKEVLKLEEDGTLIKYHPMGESVFRGQSEVLNKTVMLAGARVCMVTQCLVQTLVNLSVDTDLHSELSPGAMKLIEQMPLLKSANSKSNLSKYWSSLVKRTTGIKGEFPICRFHLERTGELDSNTYSRICRLRPVVLEQPEGRIFGLVGPTAGTRESVLAAYTLVLGESGQFAAGSNSKSAPYLFALLRCYGAVLTHLNKLVKTLSKHLDKKLLTSNVEWIKDIDNMDGYFKSELDIQFEGNIGITSSNATAAKAAEEDIVGRPTAVKINKPGVKIAAPVTTQHKPVQVPVAAQPAPALPETTVAVTKPVTNSDEGLDLNSILANACAPMQQAISSSPAAYSAPAVFSKVAAAAAPEVRPAPVHQAAPVVAKVRNSVATQAAPAQSHTGVQYTAASARPAAAPQSMTVQLSDAYNKPLFLADGTPFCVNMADVPQVQLVQSLDRLNRPMFNTDGTPVLEELAAPVGSPRQYGAPVQQQMPPQNVDMSNLSMAERIRLSAQINNAPQQPVDQWGNPIPQQMPAQQFMPQQQYAPQQQQYVPAVQPQVDQWGNPIQQQFAPQSQFAPQQMPMNGSPRQYR